MLSKLRNKLFNIDKHFLEVLQGSAWSFGGKIVAMILGLILNMMITRYYGVESMGLFALVNSFFAIALILSLMGIDTVILRLVPEYLHRYSFNTVKSLYRKIVVMIILASIIITGISYFKIEWISDYFFGKVEIRNLLSIAAMFVVINALGALNLNFIRGFKSIKLYAVLEVIRPLSKILSLLILTLLSVHIYNPVYSILVGNIFFMLISFGLVRYVLNFNSDLVSANRYERDYKVNYFSILSLSFPMFLTAALLIVISQTDIIMIGMLADVKQVGIYAIVMKLAVLTSFVMGAINTMVAPKFSELFHRRQIKELKDVAQKSSKLMFWTSFPIVLILVIFGTILLRIFGDEFTIGYVPLIIVVLGQFIGSMVGSVGYFLNMTGHQKSLNKLVVFAGALNIILNYYLIPIYGIDGAAIASAISLLLWKALAMFYTKRKFGFFIGYLPLLRVKKNE